MNDANMGGLFVIMAVYCVWYLWPRPLVYRADNTVRYDLRKVARGQSPDIEECIRHFYELDRSGDLWEASRIGRFILKGAKQRGIKIPKI